MYRRVLCSGVFALALLTGGCAIYPTSGPGYPAAGESSGGETVEYYYVDTYLSLPDQVIDLIAPYVQGWFSPEEGRYSDFLYFTDTPRSYDNYPCGVFGDFNGDWKDDYALLFSRQEEYDGLWVLTTRLLVVASAGCCYEIVTDMELGSVEADLSVPVEEYWSITKMDRGTHTYTAWESGIEITERVRLDNDAFVLRFLDTGEEDLFYMDAGEIWYMAWSPASLAKKQSRVSARATWKNSIKEKKVHPVQ